MFGLVLSTYTNMLVRQNLSNALFLMKILKQILLVWCNYYNFYFVFIDCKYLYLSIIKTFMEYNFIDIFLTYSNILIKSL